MNELFHYGSIGIVLLLAIFLFWRRGALEGSGSEPLALTLPPTVVIDRVFSPEDLLYAKSQSRAVYRLFVRDRRAMAMTWIRQIRFTSILLMRLHVKTARRDATLHAWSEARIAAAFVATLVSCELFALAVVTLGPARVKALISFLGLRIQALQAALGLPYFDAYETA